MKGVLEDLGKLEVVGICRLVDPLVKRHKALLCFFAVDVGTSRVS